MSDIPTTTNPAAPGYSAGAGPDYGAPYGGEPSSGGGMVPVPFRSPYRQGILPAWVTGTTMVNGADGNDTMSRLILSRMSAREIRKLKYDLARGGFYGPEQVAATIDQFTGELDVGVVEALSGAVGKAAAYGGNRSVEDVIASSQAAEAPFAQDLRLKAAGIDKESLVLTDPVAVAVDVAQAGQKMLGRELSQQEIETITTLLVNEERNYITDRLTKVLSPAEQGQGDPFVNPDNAVHYGRNLAEQFEVTITRAKTKPGAPPGPRPEFDTGMAVEVRGPGENVEAMRAWANGQTGQGELFAEVQTITVPSKPDEVVGLRLVFNDGAAVPDGSISRTNDDSLDRFLTAVRRPGGAAAYESWGPDQFHRGAYGVSDWIWNLYADRLGIPREKWNDRTNQDRVAREYAQDLYKRWGDWEMVAIALHRDEDTARRYAEDPSALNDEDYNAVQQILARMGSGRELASGPGQPAGQMSVPGVDDFDLEYGFDPQARMMAELKARYSKEQESARIADYFVPMLKFLGSSLVGD